MKRRFCLFFAMLFSVALIAAAGADMVQLPSISTLLRSNLIFEKTEVSDSLEEYSPFNNSFSDFNDEFRVIILQRDAPLKKFTARKTYPPFDDDAIGFPSDFEGEDLGDTRVWLRPDLMRKLPSYYCASSLRDANYLIIAENCYFLDGSISVTDFQQTTDEEMPVFEDLEEMNRYFETHQRVIDSITYYPKFGAYTIIAIYETRTKNVSYYEINHIPPKRFARNPDASDQWGNMLAIIDLLYSLDGSDQIDIWGVSDAIENLEFVPQTKKNLWLSCMDEEEYSTAFYSVNAYFWNMAMALRDMDDSENNRDNYNLIIQNRDMDTLIQYVNFCDYSGFDTPISEIESSFEYIASHDEAWTEDTLQELVDLFAD